LLVTLENGRFRAAVSGLGGELRSLFDKERGREILWQADPAWWKGSAPVLFPIVGGLREGRYLHAGREYRLGQHGFARTSEFELVSAGRDSAEFRLVSGEGTRAVYPFDFELRLSYALGATGMKHRATVRNTGSGALLFSLGFHPAFNLPLGRGRLENHHVLFESPEEPLRWFFKDGLMVSGKTASVFESSRVIALSRGLFEHGPVILRAPRSKSFALVDGSTGESLVLRTGQVPNLALWSKPGAPFVCLEPWFGLPDPDDSGGELASKPGILRLEPGRVFEAGYEVDLASRFPS